MVLVDILGSLTAGAVSFVPNLVSAIVLLIIGLVVGKIVGRVVKEVLDKVKIDYYVSETHKPVVSLSHVFSVIGRWWIYLAFITAALSRDVLGITALSVWIAEINAFIPRIIGAVVIFVVGYVIAEWVKNHLKKTKSLWAIVVGKVIFFFVIYVSIALALPILGITATLVNNILLVIIGSVGLGIAIALGLGLKDSVAYISNRYVRKLKIE